MQLWIDGVMKAEWDVLNQTMDYEYDIDYLGTGNHRIDIVYANDCSTPIPTIDRNLFVYHIKVDGLVIEPTHVSVTYDRGVLDRAFDGIDVIAGQVGMYWSGALRFNLYEGQPGTGDPSINEILNIITKWAGGQATLEEVMGIIETYST